MDGERQFPVKIPHPNPAKMRKIRWGAPRILAILGLGGLAGFYCGGGVLGAGPGVAHAMDYRDRA